MPARSRPASCSLRRHLSAGAQRRRLDLFRQCQLWLGYPDLGRDQDFLLYHTRSLYLESGLSYPIIRARERNLSIAALTFGPRTAASLRPAERRRVRSIAPARLSHSHGRRLGRFSGAINQFFFVFSQGIEGLGSTQNGSDLASRFTRPGRFHQDGADGVAVAAAVRPILRPGRVYGQYALTPLLVSETLRLWRAPVRPRFRILAVRVRLLPGAAGELRYDIPFN